MPRPTARVLPTLPALVEQKLTKTGYTRGATVRDIYQNRVARNNPVLIEWAYWALCRKPDDGTDAYENGFIVLVEPSWYFETPDAQAQLNAQGLEIGLNALLLFRRRSDWRQYSRRTVLPNGMRLTTATSRNPPLGGTYFARVAATVAEEGGQIIRGFNTTHLRGAGIRVYEYASAATIAATKLQLEALIWLCADADTSMIRAGMGPADASKRRESQLARSAAQGLLDLERLRILRILDDQDRTICPLCRRLISAADFLKRGTQAAGREVHDLTITEVSLFHIQELRVGRLQHKTYNLGWGHHFCNVVVKDAGIIPTLEWMQEVLDNQIGGGNLEDVAASVEEAVER